MRRGWTTVVQQIPLEICGCNPNHFATTDFNLTVNFDVTIFVQMTMVLSTFPFLKGGSSLKSTTNCMFNTF